MSSRFYPIYQMGNPQLRVFLPNFYMKLIQPSEKQPPNIIQFRVPLAMSEYDIRNYLEKIYKIKVMHIASEMTDGKCYINRKNYVVKDEDYRKVFVTLPRDTTFIFPDLLAEYDTSEEVESEKKSMKELKKSFDTSAKQDKNRYGVPTWFNF